MNLILPLMPVTEAVFQQRAWTDHADKIRRVRSTMTSHLLANQELNRWPEEGLARETREIPVGYANTFSNSGANFRTTLTIENEIAIGHAGQSVLFTEKQSASFDTYMADTPNVTPAVTEASLKLNVYRDIPETLAESAIGKKLGLLVSLPLPFTYLENLTIAGIEDKVVTLDVTDFTQRASQIHQDIQDRIKRF